MSFEFTPEEQEQMRQLDTQMFNLNPENRERLEERVRQLERELNAANKQIEMDTIRFKEMQAAGDKLQCELGEAQKKVADYSDAYAMLENKNVGIEQDRDAWRKVAEALQQAVRVLENNVGRLSISENACVKSALQHFTQLQKENKK